MTPPIMWNPIPQSPTTWQEASTDFEKIRQEAVEEFRSGLLEEFRNMWENSWPYIIVKSYNLPTK